MSGDLRVLVVDEDPDVRELTSTFLERSDESIVTEPAESGAAALEGLEAGDFDAVVCDYRMPGMNGLEVAEAVEDRGLDVPFVLFSAADDSATAAAVEEADVDEFVRKGTGTDHYDEIVDAIHAALDC